MSIEKISIKTGPIVEGDDFYGRKEELRRAWNFHISKGVSLKLFAPRRVGKSSFSKRMLKLAEDKGWKTLYLDVSGVSTEREFVKLFKEKLQEKKWWEKVTDTILKLFDSIKDSKVAGNKISIASDVWRNDTYSKIQQLIKSTGDILIVIDELPIFLNHLLEQENGKKSVELFLEWLKKFRQQSGTKKVCWIICGSIGIENFASMHQLGIHFSDCHPFPIGAFSENEAQDFISRLNLDVGEDVQFTEEQVRYILDKLGWYVPYYIQLFVNEIRSLITDESKQLSNDIIDEAYNRLIKGIYFNTWDERLKNYESEDTARKILRLCASPNGAGREILLANLYAKTSDVDKIETDLSNLLTRLINDGYLAERDGKYIFHSSLLKDFWYNRFIK